MPYYTAISSRPNRKTRGERIADFFSAEIDSLIAGLTPSVAKPMLNGYSMADFIFTGTRNPDCWCNGVAGITAISVGNSYAGDWRGCTLIAPDVVLMGNHVEIGIGSDILFLTNDGTNTLVTRELASRQQIGTTDIMIGRLASDVPNTIAYAKVLSTTDFSSFDVMADRKRPAALRVDRQRTATVGDFYYGYTTEIFIQPIDATRLSFYEDLINGDSGNAGAFIVGDDLILMCAWWYGFGGEGQSLHYYRNEVNAAMTALGSAYQLTEITLPL